MKERLLRLKAFWEGQLGPCAIGFSGGVDSAFVLASAKRWARVRIYPVLAVSCLLSPFAIENAQKISKEVGIPLIRFTWQPFAIDEIARNDRFRCYFCKKNMYHLLKEKVSKIDSDCHHILDGTQFDDLFRERPGLFALQELGVQTPLADYGFRKTEIRSYLKEWGYSFWNIPSESCLATKLERGERLTKQKLTALYFGLETGKNTLLLIF